MMELSPIELGRQLMNPSGEVGLKVAENMNSTNNKIYDFVISKMDINNGDKILEIGFGNGKLIPKFFAVNPNIQFSGIDFSEPMCAEAILANKDLIESGKLIISCQDSIKMPFPNDYFDSVVTINTLYFWDDLTIQLNEIKRVLRKGGRFYIGYRPKSSMENLPFTQEVFKHYDPIDLRLLTEENGFKFIKEDVQTTTIKAVDGANVQILDVCLIIEKQ